MGCLGTSKDRGFPVDPVGLSEVERGDAFVELKVRYVCKPFLSSLRPPLELNASGRGWFKALESGQRHVHRA